MGNLNGIVFPAPKPNYSLEDYNDPNKNQYKFFEEDHIIFIDSWDVSKSNN